MKKFLAILLCLLLSLCILVACDDENTDESTDSGNNSTTTTDSTKNDDNADLDVEKEKNDKYLYTMSEYITLPLYKKHSIEVKLDYIQQMIDSYIMEHATASKRQLCVIGDVVNVAYIGYRLDENGEILQEDGKDSIFDQSDSYAVYLGAGLSIPEFEEGIVGMTVGDIKEVYATFPEDYFEESLAGKTVMFEIILNTVFDAPLYTKNFVTRYFPEFSSKEDFESNIKEKIVLNELLEYIESGITIISYPEKEYKEIENRLDTTAKDFAAQMGMTLDQYLQLYYGMTRKEYIESQMKNEMIYYAIAEAEGIEITTDMLKREKTTLINYYFEEYKDMGYGENEALSKAKSFVKELGINYIYDNVLFESVEKLLPSVANVTEAAKTKTSITEILLERAYLKEGDDIGDLCPSFDIEIFDQNGASGSTVDPSRNIGKLTVINFWGTWCAPCKLELVDFNKIATDYKDVLTLYAVHSVQGYENASKYVEDNYAESDMIFLKDYLIDPNDIYEGDMYFTSLGGSGGYPYTVILDESGVIVFKHTGKMTYEELAAELEKLLPDEPVIDDSDITDEEKGEMGDDLGDLEDSLDGILGGGSSNDSTGGDEEKTDGKTEGSSTEDSDDLSDSLD